MIRCLCCNREISNPSEYEARVFWHGKCIRSFFGMKTLPEIDCSDEALEKLANLTVNILMPTDDEQMALALNGKKRNIKKKDFLTLADNMGMSEKVALSLIRQILKYKADFVKIAESAYIPDKMKDALKSMIGVRAKVLEVTTDTR